MKKKRKKVESIVVDLYSVLCMPLKEFRGSVSNFTGLENSLLVLGVNQQHWFKIGPRRVGLMLLVVLMLWRLVLPQFSMENLLMAIGLLVLVLVLCLYSLQMRREEIHWCPIGLSNRLNDESLFKGDIH